MAPLVCVLSAAFARHFAIRPGGAAGSSHPLVACQSRSRRELADDVAQADSPVFQLANALQLERAPFGACEECRALARDQRMNSELDST